MEHKKFKNWWAQWVLKLDLLDPKTSTKKKKKNGKKEFGENKISQLLQTGKVWMDLSHILRKINDAKSILFLWRKKMDLTIFKTDMITIPLKYVWVKACPC